MAPTTPQHGQRIGELLIELGLLSEPQVQQILERQRLTHHPFGAIAADMFGVDERDLWRAWGYQMHEYLPRVDPVASSPSSDAIERLAPGNARRWQVLPLRLEQGMLVCATHDDALPEALASMQINSDDPVRFVLADRDALLTGIARAYPRATPEAA